MAAGVRPGRRAEDGTIPARYQLVAAFTRTVLDELQRMLSNPS